jgi:amino acid adenylation domain-containing protein
MTLEPSDPIARLHSLVQRVPPAWWICEATNASLREQLAPSAPGLWLGQTAVPGLAALPDADDPSFEPVSAEPCYVFFTSGSTGQPKPILGRASGLAQFIDWEISTFDLAPGCRVSQLTAPTFDAWLRDVFVPLCAGGTVCLPPARKNEPDRLLAWLEASRVNLVHCVPSLLRAVLAYARQAQEALPVLAHLQRVCLSGEPLLPSLVQSWRAAFGDRIALFNFYGASETTMIRCWHRVGPADAEGEFVPVGRPIAHTQAIVLDADAQPCPPGMAGEIWLRSHFFSLGYLNDPALSAMVFVPNPLRPDDTLPVYRSGDVGLWLEDGSLRCLGRLDGQVKVNGVRIELGEIENALAAHPLVHAAVVLATRVAEGSTRLAAHVVAPEASAAALMEHLARLLPATALPHAIHLHDALPLTSTGKIDRKALASFAQQALDDAQASTHKPPQSPTEIALASLWSQVLDIPLDRIGRHDDFFALGGHSLQALTLLARLRKSMDVQLPLRTLFDARTLLRLALAVDEAVGATRKELAGVSSQELAAFLAELTSGTSGPSDEPATDGNAEQALQPEASAALHSTQHDQP